MGMQTGQISQAANQMQQPMGAGKSGGMSQDQIQSIGNMAAAGQQSPNSPTPMAQTSQPIPGQPIGGAQPAIGAGKTGGAVTMPGQTGQPQIGQPNQYSNTTGQQPALAYNQPQAMGQGSQGAKGKGA